MTEIDYNYVNQQEQLELKTNTHKQTNDDKLKYHKSAQRLAVMMVTQQRRFDVQSCETQMLQNLAAKWRTKK